MEKKMVLKLGDGQNICEDCWKHEFEAPLPTYGWDAGKCDLCLEITVYHSDKLGNVTIPE